MFADPLPFPKQDGSAGYYPRVTLGPTSSSYEKDVSGVKHVVTTKQNVTTKRFRHEFRVAITKIATDPFTSINGEAGASAYLVIDEPRYGFTDTELNSLVSDLTTYLSGAVPTDSTPVTKLLAGEY
jgi:hypothetical protein